MTRFEEMNKGILSTSDIKIYEENDSLKKNIFVVLSSICVIYLTLRRVFHGLFEAECTLRKFLVGNVNVNDDSADDFSLNPFSFAYCSHLSSSSDNVNQRSHVFESSSFLKSQYN